MTRKVDLLSLFLLLICLVLSSTGQQAPAAANVTVPSVMKFSGTLVDLNGKPLTGILGVTFYLYKDSEGGSPLWMETQNVQPDKNGRYTVTLGSSSSYGLPTDLFASGEARWLAVQAQGQPEQPRVMLMSVPYALKAADAQTIGGLPPSAFVLAAPANSNGPSSISSSAPAPSVAGTGTQNHIPIWTDNVGDLGNSVLFQSGTGTLAKVGVNTNTPAATLDVNGTSTFRGTLSLSATGAASATAGKRSQPLKMAASAFNSTTGQAVPQTFQWQAEPVGNDSSAASGSLNLLFAEGGNAPAETGLKISSNGRISFVPGQTFPSTGTITGVTAGTDLTGGGTSGNVTLNLDTTKVPQLNTVNTFTASQNINGALAVIGDFTASTIFAGPSGFDASNGTTLNVTQGNGDAIDILTGGYGVYAEALSGTALTGITGESPNTTSGLIGVNGTSLAASGIGVYGNASGAGCCTGQLGPVGVFGVVSNTSGHTAGQVGVYGEADGLEGTGMYAIAKGPDGFGLNAYATDTSEWNLGIEGQASGPSGWGVAGVSNSGTNPIGVLGLASASGGYAGEFIGNAYVTGTIFAGAKNFLIDHPLDPQNKTLSHASVESSEMMDIYTGNVVLDGDGMSVVQLPNWFEALNTDFRYLLTAIGAPAPTLYVAQKVANNEFKIAGGQPGLEVSWQITGVRHDAYAKAHPLHLEMEKAQNERGFYLHPDAFGASEEHGLNWARYPEGMKRLKAQLANHSGPAVVRPVSRPAAGSKSRASLRRNSIVKKSGAR